MTSNIDDESIAGVDASTSASCDSLLEDLNKHDDPEIQKDIFVDYLYGQKTTTLSNDGVAASSNDWNDNKMPSSSYYESALDDDGMPSKGKNSENNMSINNIGVHDNNSDLNTIKVAASNSIVVPDNDIYYFNPGAPNPEVQIINAETSKEHHQSLIENESASETNTKLKISGLRHTMTDEELKALCDPYGKIISFNIIKDKSTNQCRGFGFVKFETYEAAIHALKGLTEINFHAEIAKKPGPKRKNKTPEELLEKENKILEKNKKAARKYRRKQKGQLDFVNLANVIQRLTYYVSNVQPTSNISDEEENMAKQIIQDWIKSDYVEDRKKNELKSLVSIPHP